ncbi:GTPase Era [Gemmatimonadetes bacterium T265]|nr:GTPase Era [Gemmatimonadetes bacterium T265]
MQSGASFFTPMPDAPSSATRAGYVAIVGRPNAGKSTLLNRLVGEKLAITSPKPQSTRDRVVGIRTEATSQLVFLDTPGLLEPRYALHQAMQSAAREALRDADVVLHLFDATGDLSDAALDLAAAAGSSSPIRAPVLRVANKIDLIPGDARAAVAHEFPDAIAISAHTGAGVDALVARAADLLPESQFLYPDDELSTHPVRYFVAEMIRETALESLDDEVPYAVACEIDEYREARRPVYIRATLYVERDSQRGILIGARGARLREIGRASRAKIEAFVGGSVYLDLWVKVLHNWRRDVRALRRFGYHTVPASER